MKDFLSTILRGKLLTFSGGYVHLLLGLLLIGKKLSLIENIFGRFHVHIMHLYERINICGDCCCIFANVGY